MGPPTNDVTITCPEITYITPVQDSLRLPANGSTSGEITATKNGNSWKVSVTCTRNGDSGLAKEFTIQAGGPAHTWSNDSYDASPSALNFFFRVNVGLFVGGLATEISLILAQGHNARSRNNWWIGSEMVAVGERGSRVDMDEPATDAVTPMPFGPLLILSETIDRGIVQIWTVAGGVSDFTLDAWFSSILDGQLNPSWLRQLPDATPIGSIPLPGTHDSCSINAQNPSPWRTQTLSLTDQLRIGVRFLDIRLSVHQSGDTYTFMTCHGPYSPNEFQSLESAITEIVTYVQTHRSEFVGIIVKVDDWNDIPDRPGAVDALASFLASYPELRVPAPAELPTLGDVRGQVFVLEREIYTEAGVPQSNDLGVPITWPGNTSGALVGPVPGRAFPVYVQDHWENFTGDPATTKAQDFIKALDNKPQDGVLVNFATGVHALVFGVYIGALLLRHFGQHPTESRPPWVGWSLFDLVSTTYNTDPYGELAPGQLIIDAATRQNAYPKAFTVFD